MTRSLEDMLAAVEAAQEKLDGGSSDLGDLREAMSVLVGVVRDLVKNDAY